MKQENGPVSGARREAVLEVAGGDERLQTLLKDNRAVLVEPNIHDPARPEGSEQAVIGVYDYKRNRTVVALVDPGERKVIGVEELGLQFQLSEEERREAETLAERDDRVSEFLGRRDANALTRLYFPPHAAGDDPPHRYAIVFLRPTNSERRYAVVDLSNREVVEVLVTLAA